MGIEPGYPANKPIYVMIQRHGNLFSTGFSTDGTNYQLIPGTTADLDMPATTLQGIAVDSGLSTNTGTASFSGGGTPAGACSPCRAPCIPSYRGRAGGVQVKAADLLGMSFRSFRYYVKKYNLR